MSFWQILRLDVNTVSAPRTIEESVACFSMSSLSFASQNSGSLIPCDSSGLLQIGGVTETPDGQPEILVADDTTFDKSQSAIPGLDFERCELMIGVHVDYSCDHNRLIDLCRVLHEFFKTDKKQLLVFLIVDGLEMLTRNEALYSFFLDNYLCPKSTFREHIVQEQRDQEQRVQEQRNQEQRDQDQRVLERRDQEQREQEQREQLLDNLKNNLKNVCGDLNLREKKSARVNLAANEGQENEEDYAIVVPSKPLIDDSGKSLTVVTVLKPRRRGKLHSDLWLFSGFAQRFNPGFVALLDPEITPTVNSIRRLYHRLEDQSSSELLGVFGAPEVSTSLEHFNTSAEHCIPLFRVLNSICEGTMQCLLWSDRFEVLYAQMMYTPLENLGGYVSFPAVRFFMMKWGNTLWQWDNDSPLSKALLEYFRPMSAGDKLNWIDSNLYEFVPGIFLCLEARLSGKNRMTFAFEKEATGSWHLPSKLTRWLNYRARTLNANLLSFIKAITYTQNSRGLIKCSDRRLIVLMEFYFFALAFLFKWLAVSIYYVLSSMAVRKLFPVDSSDRNSGNSDGEDYIAQHEISGLYVGWKYVYLVVLVVTFFMALGKLGDRAKYFWLLLIWLNIVQSAFNFIMLFINIIASNARGEATGYTYVAIAIMLVIIVSFVLGTLCYGALSSAKKWLNFIGTGCIYLLLLPVYTNVVTVYSICNTSDDCQSLSVVADDVQRDHVRSVYSVKKSLFLIVFIIMNLIFGVTWEQLDIYATNDALSRKVFLVFYFIGVLVIVLPVGLLQILLKLVECCLKRREASSPTSEGMQLRAEYLNRSE